MLEKVNNPEDLRRLSPAELELLAGDIRAELLAVISRHGGHLAPNLGIVELTIAMLRVFDLERDRIIWDTGHQAYVYKLLTGRRELFQTLRQYGGCCGFLNRQESPHDHFGAGHAGTAISAALGFAAARDMAGGDARVVAVVGDGALGCGSSLEGLNNVIETTRDFILVLNDNKMSIARNVGALARYLNRMLAGRSYNRLKEILRGLVLRIPLVGKGLRRMISRLEEAAKSMIVPGVLFEELGLRYIGPLDGHDLPGLIRTFEDVRRLRQPLVVHVLTEKGRGYSFAEAEPEIYHGLTKFNPDTGQSPAAGPAAATFSDALGPAICDLMTADPRLVAITAGMCHGVGLKPVQEQHAGRFFDVGIAEEHAVVFAAGLAAAGRRPLVAIYATFMQRAVDYVFHDVCLQELPAIFCLDRAGYVGDGPTHHGIQDLPMWCAIPRLAVLQPADGDELAAMLRLLHAQGCPGIIRYPKAAAAAVPGNAGAPLEWGRAAILRPGSAVAIWALGRETATALQVAAELASSGVEAAVVNPRFVKPLDTGLLRRQAGGMPLVTLEDHSLAGGFGAMVAAELAGIPGVRLLRRGWPADTILPWGNEQQARKAFRLDAASLAVDIAAFLKQ